MEETREMSIAALRAYVRGVLLSERKKPGGGITKMGAQKVLNPGQFAVQVKGAVDSAKGDVDKAADDLDVSTRTLYHYLDTEPALAAVKTADDRESERNSEEERKGKD